MSNNPYSVNTPTYGSYQQPLKGGVGGHPMQPLHEKAGWLILLGWVSIVSGVITCLTIIGVITLIGLVINVLYIGGIALMIFAGIMGAVGR